MKPSERIKEITLDIAAMPKRNWGEPELEDWVEGILKYLDEQHDKSNQ